jgi:REP element-mobilizing transposase RayT
MQLHELPIRKRLYHDVPSWVDRNYVYFLTVNCQERGKNQLCRPAVAQSKRASLGFRIKSGFWWVHLFLLMPDHCHGLVSFSMNHGMQATVHDWKRYVARHAGVVWQRGFFEHRIRNDREFANKAHYIRDNPVRAGLVDQAGAWPYVWTGFELIGDGETG